MKRSIYSDQALGRQGHSREGGGQEQSQVATLGRLSSETRGRGQETVLKAKVPFSGTSEVPRAAGNTVRIFLLMCTHTHTHTHTQTVTQHWASSPRVAWRGASLGFQPRDGELHPEAVPLPAYLAPGVHSEAQMQSLRTLGHSHFDSR